MRRDAHTTKTASRFRGGWIAAALILAAGLAASWATAQDDAPAIDEARARLEKLVEARRLIAAEKADWRLGREMLQDRIALVEREIARLHEKIRADNEAIEAQEHKRSGLDAENDRLQQAMADLRAMVATFENRVKLLLPRLPEPLRQRVKPLSQRLPDGRDEGGAQAKLSLAQRFQNIVGILNEINKFNREIVVTSELRELPDGGSAEVTALYVGVAQGYYVSANGELAGVGRSTADGWQWTARNDAAGPIAQAIAIMKNEQPAAFIPLPAEIE